jgi:hypothetical protein
MSMLRAKEQKKSTTPRRRNEAMITFQKILRKARAYLVPPTRKAATLQEYIESNLELGYPDNLERYEEAFLAIYIQAFTAGVKHASKLPKKK